MSEEKRLIYVYAEYCPGDFFWGWWLYSLAIQDGKIERRDGEDGNWNWIHYDWLLDNLMQTLGLPVLMDYRGSNHGKCTDAFLAKYPNGVILFETENGREFELPTGTLDIELWRCLKTVREGQLLDWKNSDKSYLAWKEAQLSQLSANRNTQSPAPARCGLEDTNGGNR